MLEVLVENGPYFVVYDSNSTTLSPWSWNNHVNVLYVDQPVQVGLFYDAPWNTTLDLSNGTVNPLQVTDPVPDQNVTYVVGTYPSGNIVNTAQEPSVAPMPSGTLPKPSSRKKEMRL